MTHPWLFTPGSKVWFGNDDDDLTWRVMASLDDRWSCLTAYHSEDGLVYTIIDGQAEMRSSHDRIFNDTDFEDVTAIEAMLQELKAGTLELSRRNAVPLMVYRIEAGQ